MIHRRPESRAAASVALGILAVALTACGAGESEPGSADASVQEAEGDRPNIVLLMTDDQEVRSTEVMPKLERFIADEGVTFENAFVSYPLCCPSRATFQTGQYAHNHGVLDNRPPAGGYPAFNSDETLPVWLGDAGYETAYIGKYMNDYTKRDEVPAGWDRFFGVVEPSSRYFKVHVSDQGEFTKFGKQNPRHYSTDLFTDRAVDFIENREEPDDPFYMSVGYVSPHVAKSFIDKGHCSNKGPEPAPRHLGELESEQLPRGPSFNERDVSDKPATVRDSDKLKRKKLSAKTDKYRCRLETLLSVDDGIGEIVEALERTGELDNTYVAFVSDNGFIQGDHRIEGGKAVPYEGAIRIPMVVRGPGMPAGETARELVSNVDWVPTVLDLAEAEPGLEVDGRSIRQAMTSPGSFDGRSILIESESEPEAFKGVRTSRYLYVEREDGESELYDLREDPNELESVQSSPVYSRARSSLRKLLDRLRDCTGAECTTTPQLVLALERAPTDSEEECESGTLRFAVTGGDADFVVGVKAGVPGRRSAFAGPGPHTIEAGSQDAVPLSLEAELADGREKRLESAIPAC